MNAKAITLIYAAVRRIPKGRVATYGQIARLAGLPGRARQVGRALRELPERTDVPWQRVVNAAGTISRRGSGESESLQETCLRREGVRFEANGRIRLARFQWKAASDGAAESFRRMSGMR